MMSTRCPDRYQKIKRDTETDPGKFWKQEIQDDSQANFRISKVIQKDTQINSGSNANKMPKNVFKMFEKCIVQEGFSTN